MSTLHSRFGLQGLEHHGVTLADQPGLVISGQKLFFYAVAHRPVGDSEALGSLKALFLKGIEEARSEPSLGGLHLYYLDADGHAILSLALEVPRPLALSLGGTVVSAVPLSSLKVVRWFEAVGRYGVRRRVKEEVRDVYTALEVFQTAYQLGWGGQFFARDSEARTAIFRHFDPFRSGVLRVEETLNQLTLTLQLVQESLTGDVPYRAVTTTLAEATLNEALTWA